MRYFKHHWSMADEYSIQLLYIATFPPRCGHILPAMSSADSSRTRPFGSDVLIDQNLSYTENIVMYRFCSPPQGGPCLAFQENLLENSETLILIPVLVQCWIYLWWTKSRHDLHQPPIWSKHLTNSSHTNSGKTKPLTVPKPSMLYERLDI